MMVIIVLAILALELALGVVASFSKNTEVEIWAQIIRIILATIAITLIAVEVINHVQGQ